VSENGAGPVERVPLKVVPYYVQPIEDEPEAEPPLDGEEPPKEPARESRVPRWIVGAAALLVALATVAVHIAALVIASADDAVTSTLLAYVAIGLSAVAVIVGILAIVLRRGRPWGIVAVVLGLVANPYLLLTVLRWASGLVSA
jgi:hypothetical protein